MPAGGKPDVRDRRQYVSGAQGETIGFRKGGTVDDPTDPTDPSGATPQRAREDGIEQGFEIGYTAQLAERVVRLIGDS